MINISLENMKVKHCYHDASHQIWNSYIVLYLNNTCYFLRYGNSKLGEFSFVLLYYLSCDICSDMLTCLFYILFGFFSNDRKYKKYDRLESLILSLLPKINPNCTRTIYAPFQFLHSFSLP